MRVALVNPNWTFLGSVYFGCREPHLPLEYGYARSLLQARGHEAFIIDGHLEHMSHEEIRARLVSLKPDFTVITTAPTYLFWRCAQPELRVPQELVRYLGGAGGKIVAVGPHGSSTPGATLKKLKADAVIMGECEEVILLLAEKGGEEWDSIPSLVFPDSRKVSFQARPHASDLRMFPALTWPGEMIERHTHHHHRFDSPPGGPGAEMETSRGCPFSCTFCAREYFRNTYRRRPLDIVLKELDHLIGQGIEYVYFIDETFFPDQQVLGALRERKLKFGLQTRLDLWSPEAIDLLGEAGCVSVEIGVESISEEGRSLLNKHYALSPSEITEYLIRARKKIPFVQATLLDSKAEGPAEVEEWRQHLLRSGVWANSPVPLFPYPGSQEYVKLWGQPDDQAWERAHEHYRTQYEKFSDIQEQHFLPLSELEYEPG